MEASKPKDCKASQVLAKGYLNYQTSLTNIINILKYIEHE